MNAKYLILQVDIGSGTQWGDDRTINPIREIFIPSVESYCKKFNYKHLVITESLYEKKFTNFDFLATKKKHYSFERYFHFDNDYEYTIYLDNDVYIYPDSQPLPEFTGLRNAREAEANSSKVFREVNHLDNSYNYYNSGVTFCDRSTAKLISNYMLYRMENKIIAKGKNSDNMLLNEFILENKKIFNEMGNEWNYMPFSPSFTKIKKPNFFHFVGMVGKEIINKLQDKNINVEYFLNQLKNE
ncbi:hypothetical protein OAI01_01300 [Alphaproteobacteria bacterium]|nr:hypothetical protein [Alphaproteobacteria bacterium]